MIDYWADLAVCAANLLVGVQLHGESEVGDAGGEVPLDQDVPALHVSVRDADAAAEALVQKRQPREERLCNQSCQQYDNDFNDQTITVDASGYNQRQRND